MKKIEPEWHQEIVARCPTCGGLLLQSIYFHEMKCSKCSKYWIQVTDYRETTRPEEMAC